MTENELKHIVVRFAERQGWRCYHVPQREMFNGGGRGYPDLTCARDGEVVWIELKAEKGWQSGDQRAWQAVLPAYHLLRPSDIEGRMEELLR
jgi:hypothetical protein